MDPAALIAQDSPQAWRMAIAVAVCLVVSSPALSLYTAGVFMKPIVADLGWTRGGFSTASAMSGLTAAFAAPFIGRIVDRRGARFTLLVGVPLMALGFFVTAAFARSPLTYMAFAVLGGLAAPVQSSMPYARIIVGWFNRRRGIALGVALSGVGVGAALSPRISQALIETEGWRVAHAALGAALLVIAYPVILLVLKTPAGASKAIADAPALEGLSVRAALKSRLFWVMAFGFFTNAAAVNGAVVHLPALITDRGFSPGLAATIAGLFGVTMLLGRLIAGWFVDRYAASKVAFWLFVPVTLALLVLASGFGGVPVLIACAVCVGVAMGAEIDLVALLVSRNFGLAHFSEIYGYQLLLFTIGIALGPAILGRVFDAQGAYGAGLVGLAAASLVGALALLSLGEPGPTEPVSHASPVHS